MLYINSNTIYFITINNNWKLFQVILYFQDLWVAGNID